MASNKMKAAPIGSAQWILNEIEVGSQMAREESEEFRYAVRSEMEWLNAHMEDIFSRNYV